MVRAMKDSGIEWIGEIPEDWELVQMKRYVTVNNGREIGMELSRNDDSAVPVYGSGGVFKYTNTFMHDGEAVLFGRKGTLGKPIYAKGKLWAVDTMYFLSFSESSVGRFIYYQLIAFDWQPHITHTALPSIVASEIVSCRFPRPSLYEQHRIAVYLDARCAEIDTVLEKTRASIEEYKKLKQAVITQAVTKGVRGKRQMKESGIAWAASIPEEWEVKRGKQLFRETNERSESGEEELLTVSHITGVTPRSQKNVNMFMSESLVGYKICHTGDLAANTMWMWQGAIGDSKYEGVISPSYNTYRQITGAYDSEYLDYLLRIKPLVDTYSAYSTGITVSRLRLYPDQFLSILFIVPPMEEQREIADYLDTKIVEGDKLIAKKEQFITELESYKKSLIYEYVTGKKEVPTA